LYWLLTYSVEDGVHNVVQLSDDSGSVPGESPYIGKGRFHENDYAVERRVPAKHREVEYAVLNGSTSSCTVSDVRASASQGQLDFINGCRQQQQQPTDTAELQQKLHALADGQLCEACLYLTDYFST